MTNEFSSQCKRSEPTAGTLIARLGIDAIQCLACKRQIQAYGQVGQYEGFCLPVTCLVGLACSLGDLTWKLPRSLVPAMTGKA